jgi:hypothetical protein
MAKAAKPKPKPKKTDKAQFERFVETARELGVEDVGSAFDNAFKRIVPPKQVSEPVEKA